jgi:hypothetical protein
MGSNYQRSMVGPVLLILVGLLALLIQNGYLNAFHLLHWYIRWWPELLIGVGVVALCESWIARDHCCSSAAKIAFIICCLAFLVSHHGDFGIYVCGHLVNGDDIARLLSRE